MKLAWEDICNMPSLAAASLCGSARRNLDMVACQPVLLSQSRANHRLTSKASKATVKTHSERNPQHVHVITCHALHPRFYKILSNRAVSASASTDYIRSSQHRPLDQTYWPFFLLEQNPKRESCPTPARYLLADVSSLNSDIKVRALSFSR